MGLSQPPPHGALSYSGSLGSRGRLEPCAARSQKGEGSPLHLGAPVGLQEAGSSSLKPGGGQQTTLGASPLCPVPYWGPPLCNKMEILGLQGTEMSQMVFTRPLASALHPLAQQYSAVPGTKVGIFNCVTGPGSDVGLLLRWAVGKGGVQRGCPALSSAPSGNFQAASQANVRVFSSDLSQYPDFSQW